MFLAARAQPTNRSRSDVSPSGARAYSCSCESTPRSSASPSGQSTRSEDLLLLGDREREQPFCRSWAASRRAAVASKPASRSIPASSRACRSTTGMPARNTRRDRPARLSCGGGGRSARPRPGGPTASSRAPRSATPICSTTRTDQGPVDDGDDQLTPLLEGEIVPVGGGDGMVGQEDERKSSSRSRAASRASLSSASRSRAASTSSSPLNARTAASELVLASLHRSLASAMPVALARAGIPSSSSFTAARRPLSARSALIVTRRGQSPIGEQR